MLFSNKYKKFFFYFFTFLLLFFISFAKILSQHRSGQLLSYQPLSSTNWDLLKKGSQGKYSGKETEGQSKQKQPELPSKVATPSATITTEVPILIKPTPPMPSISEPTVEKMPAEIASQEEFLKPFGYDFFLQSPSTFAPVAEFPVPETYSLAPGDTIKLVFWQEIGPENVQILKVNYNGQIQVPYIGLLSVKGFTLKQLETTILKKLKSRFENIQGYVMLEELRSIQVFVTGEAKRPGGYTICGLSTAFNSLYYAGGPSEKGTMRAVKVIRNNKTISTIDLYKYLLSGDKSNDIQLESGDTIFIPIVGGRVKILGKIKRPAIYEITNTEKITDILEMAGGLDSSAFGGRIQLERIENNNSRVLIDIDATQLKETSPENIKVQDGDKIFVFEIIPEKFSFVEIKGKVNRPGLYELKANMKVKDLINTAEGFKEDEEIYMERAEIIRINPDKTSSIVAFNLRKALENDPKENILLQPKDTLIIYGPSEVTFVERKVEISGAIQRPGKYRRKENMDLKTLIFQAGGLLPESFNLAEISRQKANKTEIIYSDVHKLINENDESQNVLLEDGDKIFFRALNEYKRTPEFVYIEGEVSLPGAYALKENETVYSLIERAGGLTKKSFLAGAVFFRKSENIVNVFQEHTVNTILNLIIETSQKQYESYLAKYGVKTEGVKSETSQRTLVSPTQIGEGISSILSAEQVLTQAINKETLAEMGKNEKEKIFTPREFPSISKTNRIPIDFIKIYNSKGKEGDILLKEGDKIIIPAKPDTIMVLGAVINPSAVLFEKEKDIKYYVNKVGGFAEDANQKKIIVVKAQGIVVPAKSVKFLELGDIIIVPYKAVIEEEKSKGEKIKEIIRTISDIGISVYIIDQITK